jgi:flagellin-like protein
MKANRKFIQAEDEAVSAVIGVILMVAITVAIAATVYVYLLSYPIYS